MVKKHSRKKSKKDLKMKHPWDMETVQKVLNKLDLTFAELFDFTNDFIQENIHNKEWRYSTARKYYWKACPKKIKSFILFYANNQPELVDDVIGAIFETQKLLYQTRVKELFGEEEFKRVEAEIQAQIEKQSGKYTTH